MKLDAYTCELHIDIGKIFDNGFIETKLSFYTNLNEFTAKKYKNVCTEK